MPVTRSLAHYLCIAAAALFWGQAALGWGMWIRGPSALEQEWREAREMFAIKNEGGLITLLVVPGFRQEAPPLKQVYCSGSAPYKETTIAFVTARRTMLDLVIESGAMSASDVNDLTQSYTAWGLLIAALQANAESPGDAPRAALAAVDKLVTDGACSSPLHSLLKAAKDAVEAWTKSNGKRKAAVNPITEVHRYMKNLEGRWSAAMLAYKNIVNQTGGRDYPTHCEIMYLYDVWRASPARCLPFSAALPSLFRWTAGKPRLIVISKPMCENCEPNIVRAWAGVERGLYVVTEREPNRVEKGHHDASSRVKKIDAPLDGREPYVPTP